jgi:hypothetical protein
VRSASGAGSALQEIRQGHYPGMYLKRLPIFFVVISLLFDLSVGGQDDNPLDDADQGVAESGAGNAKEHA